MKLTSVTIKGIRGIADSEYCLDGVVLVTGPNGSGKTTVLGSVLFALTGRFPGLPATSASFPLMGRNGSMDFAVKLTAAANNVDYIIIRSVKKGKASVWLTDGAEELQGKDAESKIRHLFGDVAFLAEALDPQGSVWGLSREKRKAWASALCRSVAGWTKADLVREIGPARSNWNPDAMPEAGATLDLHVAKLADAVRDAQAVARQAEAIADNISGIDAVRTPSSSDIAQAESEYEHAQREVYDAEQAKNALASEEARANHIRSQRKEVERRAAAAASRLSQFLIPSPPADATELRKQVDAEDAKLWEVEMALSDARAQARSIQDRLSASYAVEKGLVAAVESGCCPTCGSHGEFAELLQTTKAAIALLKDALTPISDRITALTREEAERAATMRQLNAKLERASEDEKAYAANVEQAVQSKAILAKSVAELEEWLVSNPEPSAPPSSDEIDKRLATAKSRVAHAKSRLAALRSEVALSNERDTQKIGRAHV